MYIIIYLGYLCSVCAYVIGQLCQSVRFPLMVVNFSHGELASLHLCESFALETVF